MKNCCLSVREWATILLVIGFFLSINLIAKASSTNFSTISMNQNSSKKMITVSLNGAIQNPGDYQCEPGCSLRELLTKAKMLKDTDRKKIPFKKILFTSQAIEIPQKKTIRGKGEKFHCRKKSNFGNL